MVRQPFWSKILIKLSHLLLSSSSAANILIYSAKVDRARKLKLDIIGSS